MPTQAQAAAEKRSQYVKAVMDRGLALFHEGKLRSAELLFETVAAEPAVRPLVQHMRGVIAIHLGEEERALDFIEEAIRLNPADAEAHANLGRILLKDRQHPQALAAYAAALTLQPHNVPAHYGLAKALAALGLTDLAFDAFRDVVARAPDYVEAVVDFGSLLNDMGQHAEAAATLRDALTRHPGRAELEAGLAVCSFPSEDKPDDMGEHARAAMAFRDVLARHPQLAEVHSALAWCLFALGDWPAAWAEYEWRLKDPQLKKNLLASNRPRWQGEDLTGKTILLQYEQGYGDVLQFVRYAPMVKARGGRVIVRAQEPLLPLLRSVTGVDAVFGTGDKAPTFDVHAPLLSLPMIFGTRIDTIPAAIPYLKPDPALVRTWRERLGAHSGVTVGLFWQGNPTHPNDRHRSIRLDALRPLLDCPGARFVSLQVGPGREQLKGQEDSIADLGAAIDSTSFADAAAIVASLDLVISVDSAIGHLAGALGKRAWILLAVCNDWRWLKGRRDSPWYPQAQLFRQRTPGEWDEVVRRVRAELWAFAGAGPPQAMTDTVTELALRATLPPRAVDPVVCDALFMEGVRHHRANDCHRSKKLFEQVLLLDPRHVNTLCNLGALELNLGHRVRALALLERAVALSSKLVPARIALADALLASGKTGQAIKQYREAIELAPKDDAVHAAYAMALCRLGEFDGAMVHFQQAAKINQRQPPEFYEALGRTCAARGNREGAEISLKHALALNPRLVTAHSALGDLYLALGRKVEADASFQRAVAIDPTCGTLRGIGHQPPTEEGGSGAFIPPSVDAR
jgi:tetratricopeptide (TPR) repeat protein